MTARVQYVLQLCCFGDIVHSGRGCDVWQGMDIFALVDESECRCGVSAANRNKSEDVE